jgi:hypothetical protein
MSGNLQFLWETELVSNPVAKKLHAIVAESLNSSNSKVVFVLQNIVLNQGVNQGRAKAGQLGGLTMSSPGHIRPGGPGPPVWDDSFAGTSSSQARRAWIKIA